MTETRSAFEICLGGVILEIGSNVLFLLPNEYSGMWIYVRWK